MKFLILFLISDLAFTALQPYRFAEVTSFTESSSLPPKLTVKFELMCNEKFVKVIRHEHTDKKSKKVTIAVGVLVEENILSSCAGESRELEADAGNTFSGRPYEVSPIKK